MKFIAPSATLVFSALVIALRMSTPAHATSDAPRANKDKDECVFFRTVSDFKPLDRNKLVIWGPARRDAYLVELSMPLPDLQFSHRLALVDGNNDGRLCSFGMDRVVVTGSSFDQPTTIRSMTRLDDEHMAQLEEQYGVKLTRKPHQEREAAQTE